MLIIGMIYKYKLIAFILFIENSLVEISIFKNYLFKGISGLVSASYLSPVKRLRDFIMVRQEVE